MCTEKPKMGMSHIITLGLIFASMSFVTVLPIRATGDYGKDLRLTIHTDREVFQCGEAVPLNLKVTNNDETTIWFVMADPYIEVTDTSGERIRAPIPDPTKTAPSHYYMERNGKRVYTVPVLRIDGGQTVSEIIPDALKYYHRYVSTGIYHLKATRILGFYNETEVFRRVDYPKEFWVEPTGDLRQVKLVSNSIKIKIREHNLFPWPYLLVAAGFIGVAVVGIVLFLKRRAINQSK